ncbi:hypothetical protein [Labedaea rhizosphaerae]|uniref:Uncharacterized protein n=1 Tax=Labedaea rhizosphaerae TaxID=598644 RepID=A0A4R6RZT5_LABRH|nr:hypothetical protein [Labedaea rhizosphaerae]TDP92157.1 hypothetical protein EV186_108370 [Labedaea rhizosphaerae]
MPGVDDSARTLVMAWDQQVNHVHTGLQLAGDQPVAADSAAARAAFFGPTPPGAQRTILQTGAVVPGGKDGIIVGRFYIPSLLAAEGNLYGDNRGPSTDPNASSRFSVAWDTATGEVSVTVSPSTTNANGSFYPPNDIIVGPFGVPVQVPPSVQRHDEVVPARPITIGPGGEPNNFVVNAADPTHLDLNYNLLNSVIPVGQANGHLGLSLTPDAVGVHLDGDDYPAGEFVQYRSDGARLLGDKPMPLIQEGAVVGIAPIDRTWTAPR